MSEEPPQRVVGPIAARRAAEELRALTGLPVETISRMTPDPEGWTVVVDLLERRAIPDSHDVLASYEVRADPAGALVSYERVRRYRRADVDA